ncbi:hypothetical protein FJR38_02900 [Anabaena sp. UHCC 0253]|nr:hypothetical protein [Anabaena sp. UHCC 0253]
MPTPVFGQPRGGLPLPLCLPRYLGNHGGIAPTFMPTPVFGQPRGDCPYSSFYLNTCVITDKK